MASPENKSPISEMPLVAHLVELRNRMMKAVLFVMVFFLACVPFANDLYTILASPLLAHLPEGATMIATKVASPFFTPFKLTLVFSIFLAMPFILYQVWGFIAPGLYKHERRMMFPLLASSTFLFYLGAVFAYYVVFPIVFKFFTSAAPEGVTVMTDISEYLDFVLKMFFAFGIAFEVPIATIVLVWMGLTTPKQLGEKRPYIIVGAFVVGMLLTPPDAISQTLLAVPVIILFEFGLFFSKAFVRKRGDEDEEEPVAESGNNIASQENVGDAQDHYHDDHHDEHHHDMGDYEMTDEEFEREFDQAEKNEEFGPEDEGDKPK